MKISQINKSNYSTLIVRYQEAVILDPNDAHAHYNLGSIYKILGLKAKANASWSSAAHIYRKQGKIQDYQNVMNLIFKYCV